MLGPSNTQTDVILEKSLEFYLCISKKKGGGVNDVVGFPDSPNIEYLLYLLNARRVSSTA